MDWVISLTKDFYILTMLSEMKDLLNQSKKLIENIEYVLKYDVKNNVRKSLSS